MSDADEKRPDPGPDPLGRSRRAGGLDQLVCSSVREVENRIDALQDAWQSGDVALLRRLAHQLRVAADGQGLTEISSKADQLYAGLEEQADIDGLREKLEALILLCRRGAPPLHGGEKEGAD